MKKSPETLKLPTQLFPWITLTASTLLLFVALIQAITAKKSSTARSGPR